MFMRIIWVMLFFLATFSSVNASVINGDFSDGLNGWTAEGDVTDSGGEASIADDGAVSGYGVLYQGIALTPGNYTLEFDFSGDLSATVSQGTFPDLFAASIYFIDNIGAFDLSTPVFDDSLTLFDLDHTGVSAYNGTESTSTKGAGWSRWSVNFTNAYAYAIPTFEMIDRNWDEDSSALIDNVTITQIITVPEPATLMLFMTGLLGVWVQRGRASS